MQVPNDYNLTEDQVKHQYQYHQLPSKTSFRIMELLPGEKSAPISYRLQIADWSRSTRFESVSYAWGDVNRKIISTCDGLNLMITNNLRDCLVAMRYTDQSRFLWVDAICIDQTNTEERGHQVSHMGDFYRRATRVVVWLGRDENDQVQRSIAAIKEIVAQCLGQEESVLRSRDELWRLIPEHLPEGLQHYDEDSLKALSWFFSRSWFSRLWVIQEVISNPNVEVLCGGSRISWDVVALAATYIWRHRHTEVYRRLVLDHSLTFNIYYMRRRFWHRHVSLPSLLNWGRFFNATESLDRVYGLMALPSFANSDLCWIADYTKSKLDLYQDVAYKCISKLGSLRILCYSQHHGDDKTFPSWVPQWDRKARYQAIDESLTKAQWKSSGNVKLSADIDMKYGVLKLTGIILDAITSFYPLSGNLDIENGQVSQDNLTFDFWERQQQQPSKYFTGESQLEAFSVVMTAGLNINRRKASETPKEFYNHFNAYLSHLLQVRGRVQGKGEPFERIKEQGESDAYQGLAQCKCRNRSFFFTQTGYMGLGPDVQTGDLVCIFFGAEVPFVLRPKSACYEFIGDAYVHGVMEGEAVGMQRPGILKKTTFEIH
ncbi:heterokaryon incompatibility protein-domain-containing protein [Annulohypoxylon stygium]|nr:heterokaryon incompatibility protein-domain-containing protein [Annulohypoxylon stygium]